MAIGMYFCESGRFWTGIYFEPSILFEPGMFLEPVLVWIEPERDRDSSKCAQEIVLDGNRNFRTGYLFERTCFCESSQRWTVHAPFEWKSFSEPKVCFCASIGMNDWTHTFPEHAVEFPQNGMFRLYHPMIQLSTQLSNRCASPFHSTLHWIKSQFNIIPPRFKHLSTIQIIQWGTSYIILSS